MPVAQFGPPCNKHWVGASCKPLKVSPLQSIARRYGAPIVVLSLLKRAEKQPRECLLGQEFEKAVTYINGKARSCVA